MNRNRDIKIIKEIFKTSLMDLNSQKNVDAKEYIQVIVSILFKLIDKLEKIENKL